MTRTQRPKRSRGAWVAPLCLWLACRGDGHPATAPGPAPIARIPPGYVVVGPAGATAFDAPPAQPVGARGTRLAGGFGFMVTDERTIVLAVEDDPTDDNHERSMDNVHRLELAASTWPGGLRIVRIPFPRPVMMQGERLPASYANFYIANGVVMVPTFNDPNDRTALNTLAELFPRHEVVGIHAVDLVWGLGTLHCLTQQQPASP